MNPTFQLFGSLAFAFSCWGIGKIFVGRFPASVFSPLLSQVLSFAFGNILLSYLITLLSLLGLLRGEVLWAIFGFSFSIASYFLNIALRNKSTEQRRMQWPDWLTLTGLTLFSIPAAAIALAPPFMRDTLVYHLAAPKAFLQSGGLTFQGGNFFFAFPKGHEMLMTLLLGTLGDRAAQLLGVWQLLAAGGGVYALVANSYGKPTALIAVLGFVSIPTTVYVAGAGYVESAILLSLVASLICLQRFSTERTPIVLIAAGLAAGWLLALKYTGLMFCGILGLMLLVQLRRDPIKKAIWHILFFCLPVLPGGFWLLRNWFEIGNPVFPFAYEIFGGDGWDFQRAAAYKISMLNYGMGRGLTDYLLLPWRLAFEGQFDSLQFDGYLGPMGLVFLIFALLALFLRKEQVRSISLSGLGYAAIAFGLFFIFGTQQIRFYLPAHLFLCLLAAPTIHYFLVKKSRFHLSAFAIGFVLCLLVNAVGILNQLRNIDVASYLSGAKSKEMFLTEQVPTYLAISYINQYTPEQSKIFTAMTGNYGYYLDRSFIADSFIEDYSLRRWLDSNNDNESLYSSLKGMGITHLYFKVGMLEKSLSPDQMKKLTDFLIAYGFLLLRDNDLFVVAIKEKAQETSRAFHLVPSVFCC